MSSKPFIITNLKKKDKSMQDSIQTICMRFVENQNAKTFNAVVSRLRPGIIKHLTNYEKDYETRSHLADTTFTKLWTEILKYDSAKGHFSTWAYTIARNEALQHKRYTNRNFSFDNMLENGSKKLLNNMDIDEINIDFEGDRNVDVISILYDKVLNCIYSIDELKKSNSIYKEALVKKIIEQKKYSVIANEIGVNENTVKARVRNGKKIIGSIISKESPELIEAFKRLMV